MPYEDKELSNAWKIKFIDCIEDNRRHRNMARFEVISPDGKGKFVGVFFSMEFIDAYFRIPEDENRTENHNRILQEKENLIKAWGFVKIEECLDQNTLGNELKILTCDFPWAEKVEKGFLKPSSEKQSDNNYIYIPEKRIGFR